MDSDADRARARQLVHDLLGPSDAAADRAVTVLHAHAAALAWVRDVTGRYPAPDVVAAQLEAVAHRLRAEAVDEDPVAVLHTVAVEALAAYRHTNAA
jgi:hypothetical protein